MSGRGWGFIVARGTAVLLALNGTHAAIDAYSKTAAQGAYGAPPGGWIIYYLPSALGIALALVLWTGARKFGPTDEEAQADEPLTTQSALGLILVGVGLFELGVHAAGAVNFIWLTIDPHATAVYDWRPHYWADVASTVAAVVVIAIGRSRILDLKAPYDDQEQA